MVYDIYNPYENQTVTSDYVSLIEKCLNANHAETEHITSIAKNPENKEKGIVVVLVVDAIKAKFAGYKKVILWVQGAAAAESFMRRKSRLRYAVLSAAEFLGLKCADLVLFVSNTMQEYYENRFKFKIKNSYIMPCFNNEIDEKFFVTPQKYENNVFVYAGSLAPWQCFEPTVKLYKEIENRVENASFRVLVKDHETAKTILDKYGVKNYSLGFVPQSEIGKEMAKAKFGFCIREDSIVNRVATPTKLSTYIAHGVMPVYTDYLVDFKRQSQGCPYCFCVDYNDPVAAETIADACKSVTTPEDVIDSYTKYFGNYFSKKHHEKELSEAIKVLFK